MRSKSKCHVVGVFHKNVQEILFAWRIFVRGRFTRDIFAETFELEMPIEFADFLGILTPVGHDLHKQCEINLDIEKFFQLFAGFGADFF